MTVLLAAAAVFAYATVGIAAGVASLFLYREYARRNHRYRMLSPPGRATWTGIAWPLLWPFAIATLAVMRHEDRAETRQARDAERDRLLADARREIDGL